MNNKKHILFIASTIIVSITIIVSLNMSSKDLKIAQVLGLKSSDFTPNSSNIGDLSQSSSSSNTHAIHKATGVKRTTTVNYNPTISLSNSQEIVQSHPTGGRIYSSCGKQSTPQSNIGGSRIQSSTLTTGNQKESNTPFNSETSNSFGNSLSSTRMMASMETDPGDNPTGDPIGDVPVGDGELFLLLLGWIYFTIRYFKKNYLQ